MQIHVYDTLPGHDGACLPPVGERADVLALRYSLLDRFSRGWQDPEEGLKNFQALASLNVLPADAVFYLIASVLVDEIAQPRILSLFDALSAEDEQETPPAYAEPIHYDAQWAFIAERLTAETMCEHEEWAMADMFLNDRLQFEGRIEAGRRFFHGS